MNTPAEHRPSPEALLKEAKTEHQGRLKIFLGAAPGVGKTYAMLNAARARIADGVDTVIGIVETHQRSETQQLADGIEQIQKQKLEYRGLTFEEMDLDAVLRRKPKLVLVDELAHTNIPGARHPKRYQDVQEILEAGIDVYSTLNVQHIESLNDIVVRITGVQVRETVPDSIMQMAHAIELIDLPPDELLQRLKDGKVYIPEQARLAVNRFFTPGNLTALRELALRQAAERVDEQMSDYMRRHAISGPWPTSSRIMVCISDDKQAASLVRTARRTAERRQTPWIILYVETSRHSFMSDHSRNDIAQAMEMGEAMGAELMTVAGEDVAGEVLRVARERNVSTIIIGKSVRSAWSRMTRPSVAAAVMERGDGFDILLVNKREPTRPGTELAKSIGEGKRPWKPDWAAIGKVTFVLTVTSLIGWSLVHFVASAFLPSLFLVSILLVVLDLGVRFALASTFVSMLVLDLLMTMPNLTIIPEKRSDFIAWVSFLPVAVAISAIGDRVHRQTRLTQLNAERTQSLYDFTKSIAAAATIDDVSQATVRRVASALGARTALLLPRNERLEVVAAMPADLHLDTASNAAMDWAWQHRKPAGWKSDTLPSANFHGMPLQAGANTVGVLAVRTDDGLFTSDQHHFLSSLAYQAAISLERAKLVSDIAQARLQTETEKLRASLLSSISHDLRAPLDNIILTTHNLNSSWQDMPPDDQRAQVKHIEHEADRLDRYIENLLDMTELVTGNVRFNRESVSLPAIIDEALDRLGRRVKKGRVQLDYTQNMPMVEGDAPMLRRVFVNLIENATSYSPQEQPVFVSIRQEGSEIKVIITDRGPGIPEADRERVFDMFYRVKKAGTLTSSAVGAGLGLSICRGFIEAHQGSIAAQPGPDGKGTSIVIRLPVSPAAA